ncbi:MAG: HAD family phosphatase [Treponemataceae bacterium]|nr:HAD family phosphatase [Treponemataceae bacterium]
MTKDISQIISKTKAIIFDMDGVLLDSESICDYAWEKAASEQGLLDISEGLEKCRGTTKIETKKILNQLYCKPDSNFQLDVELFMQRTHEIFYEVEEKEGIELMYYAKEALEFLGKKFVLALASSTRGEPVHRQLTNVGLIDYFEVMITGDMVSNSKPDPEIYLKACSELNLKPEECIAVEDSPNGIKSAFDAGIPVVMIPDKIAPNKTTENMTIMTVENLEAFCDIFTE